MAFIETLLTPNSSTSYRAALWVFSSFVRGPDDSTPFTTNDLFGGVVQKYNLGETTKTGTVPTKFFFKEFSLSVLKNEDTGTHFLAMYYDTSMTVGSITKSCTLCQGYMKLKSLRSVESAKTPPITFTRWTPTSEDNWNDTLTTLGEDPAEVGVLLVQWLRRNSDTMLAACLGQFSRYEFESQLQESSDPAPAPDPVEDTPAPPEPAPEPEPIPIETDLAPEGKQGGAPTAEDSAKAVSSIPPIEAMSDKAAVVLENIPTPAAAVAAVTQGAYLPHLPAERLAQLDYGCQTVIGLMGDMINAIETIISVPLTILRRIEALVSDVLNSTEDAVNGLIDDTFNTLDVFDDMIPDFKGPTFPDVLNDLMDCPFIADSPLGAGIAGMLDQIDEIGEILEMPSDFIQDMNKSAQGMVSDTLGSVEDAAIGKLDALEDMYESMLDNLGVFDLLDFMADLQTCVEALCQAAEDAAALYEETTEKLRVAKDDAGNWKQIIRDKMDDVSDDSKTALQTTKDKLTSLKDRATNTQIIPETIL